MFPKLGIWRKKIQNFKLVLQKSLLNKSYRKSNLKQALDHCFLKKILFKDSFVQMYSLNQENVALLIKLTYRKNIWCTAPSDREYNLLLQIFEPSCHGFSRIRPFETCEMLRLGFKSNNKVKVQVEPIFFLDLVQSWPGLGLVKILSLQHKYQVRYSAN